MTTRLNPPRGVGADLVKIKVVITHLCFRPVQTKWYKPSKFKSSDSETIIMSIYVGSTGQIKTYYNN